MAEMNIGDGAEYIMDSAGVYHPCTDKEARTQLEGIADKIDNLGQAASYDVTETVAKGSKQLITSGGVYEALDNISVIKSIRRGVGTADYEVENISIPLDPPVDPAKCIVILDNSILSASGTTKGAYVVSLDTNALTVRINYNQQVPSSDYKFGWQVVEFK